MKKNLLMTIAAAMVITLTACNSWPVRQRYTDEYTPRDGQEIWFTPDETTITVRLVASCISGSEMATDFHRAARKYAEYIRLCYYNISQDSVDVDAGIRAINFIRKLHRDAEGSDKFWEATIELAKSNNPKLLGKPIPQDYN